ncbi:LacI family DNA-binding transcriptional regulator [Piscicoccus intestinalis]|uniref:LacI family DNA-binding transcriptional regulator n=1 Tax=Piscicoccus intestinalis TaxID=746033 RepID=UPI00083969CD|nr:LacI family DNA-binding transcriptional regulator [Piscicoccus intestinalis]
MRAPRLADVAARAGVSEATVSRVLNAKPGVSESTRTAVLAAVDLLGYDRPPKLRRASVGLVGLVVPELTNPVFPAYVQAMEDELTRRDYTPILCTQTPGGVEEDDYVQMLGERGVSGMIFVSGLHADSTTGTERYERLRERSLPIVCVNGYREGIDAPFVSDDDIGAMTQSIEHLVGLGHRRIGLATGPLRFVPAWRKLTGFRQAMAQRAGEGDVDELVAETLFTVEGGAEAADVLLQRGCTAVVCASDLMALGAVAASRARGLRVPDDVSVVGYDDSLLMGFTDPPLTTVRQDVPGIAHAAVAALLDEIHGHPAARAELVFRSEFVVRGSTAPPGSTARRG